MSGKRNEKLSLDRTQCEVNTEGTLEINACLFICSKYFLAPIVQDTDQGSPSPTLAELSA